MIKKKREGKINKRIFSIIMTAVMTVPLLTGVSAKDMSEVRAAATLSNPRNDAGVVTWDCVYFGKYPQSDATGVVKDAIKWRVLSVNGNDAFLLADSNLDAQQYNRTWIEGITWENSTMRSWLNGYAAAVNSGQNDYTRSNFINTAFVTEEQEAIIATAIANNEGNPTTDKIFLLSNEEVMNPAYGFLATADADLARVRVNTAYVGAGGVNKSTHTNPAGQAGWWWLRSKYSKNAGYVGATGVTYTDGPADSGKFAVCPALHLDLSKTSVWSYAGTVNSNGVVTLGEQPPVVVEKEKPVEDSYNDASYVKTGADGQEQTVEYVSSETKDTEVMIPDQVSISGIAYKVTSVADNAFKNNKKLTRIVIGNNVKRIGKNAFSGCTNLESVVIGSGVEVIDKSAFSGCTALQAVKIGKNVTTIGEKAFFKCTALKEIVIPAKVKTIGKKAFYGCKNLKNITINTKKLTNKSVGSKAFNGVYAKATYKVPKKKLASYKKMLKAKGAGSKSKIVK